MKPASLREEVRLIIYDANDCADVAAAFAAAGIVALGDYRLLPQDDLIFDALIDRVDFLVVRHIFDPFLNAREHITNIHDLQVRIGYKVDDDDVKLMHVGAAIQMVLRRRRAL